MINLTLNPVLKFWLLFGLHSIRPTSSFDLSFNGFLFPVTSTSQCMLAARSNISRHIVKARAPHPWRSYSSETVDTRTSGRYVGPYQSTKRSAFIRTGSPVESPVEALAVIRAVERKYGSIWEYKWLRVSLQNVRSGNQADKVQDCQVGTSYQLMCRITFRDARSHDRIPLDSETIQIPRPTYEADHPGGVGLEEIEGLLRRQDLDNEIPSFETIVSSVLHDSEHEAKASPTISLRVERASTSTFFQHWYGLRRGGA